MNVRIHIEVVTIHYNRFSPTKCDTVDSGTYLVAKCTFCYIPCRMLVVVGDGEAA